MNGYGRRMGRHLQSLLASMCVVAATWGVAASCLADATVELSTSDGIPGGTAKLTMSITRQAGDPGLAGAQVDLILDRSQLGVDAQCSESAGQCDSGLDCEDAEACVLLSCQRDPRLPAAVQLIANSPRFQNVNATHKRLRLGVVGPVIPVTTFEDGVVLTCDLDIPASAGLGVQSLTADRLVVSDEVGDIIPATVVIVPGSIVDSLGTPTAAMTATSTATATGGTPTPTLTGTSGPSTPTSTPTGGGPPTSTSTSTPFFVHPTATPVTPVGPATATPTPGGKKGGGGGGCNCAIAPEADSSKGTALIWLSLLPIALVSWRRSRRR